MIQVSLLLSTGATLWVAFQGDFLPMLLLSLALHGAVTRSRMPLAMSIVADSLPEEDRDAAFSVFSFLGFASAPLWIMVIAWVMDGPGFTFAFTMVSLSYLTGMLLMLFVADPRRSAPVAGSPRGSEA